MGSVRVEGTALTVDTLSRIFFNVNGRVTSSTAPTSINLSLPELILRRVIYHLEDLVSCLRWGQNRVTRWRQGYSQYGSWTVILSSSGERHDSVCFRRRRSYGKRRGLQKRWGMDPSMSISQVILNKQRGVQCRYKS